MEGDMDREQRDLTDKDDQDWFALLTGQSVPDAHPATAREAQALRRAVLAEHATPVDEGSGRAGLERLLFRLRREGLLTPRRPVWRRPAVWSAVAAAALVVSLLPWMLSREPHPGLLPDPVPVQKGLRLPQVLYAADPLDHARTLQAALTALGIAVQHLSQGDSQVLMAQLPQSPEVAVRDVLQQYRLTVPSDGKLLVEILPAQQKP